MDLKDGGGRETDHYRFGNKFTVGGTIRKELKWLVGHPVECFVGM